MENGLLVSVSHQGVLRRQMDIIANNLANINTAGFRAERLMIAEQPMSPRADAGRRGDLPPIFVRDLVSVTDTTEGRIEMTGNPLDLAVRGDGFFVVNDGDDPRYTRNGHFRLDETGQLVTESGLPVMGQDGRPITLPTGEGDITVAGDGTIGTAAGPVGKLRVVRFAAAERLIPAGSALFRSEEAAQDVLRPVIEQGMVVASNVEPIIEMEKMIRVHRAYDGARGLLDREDDRIKKMLQVYAA